MKRIIRYWVGIEPHDLKKVIKESQVKNQFYTLKHSMICPLRESDSHGIDCGCVPCCRTVQEKLMGKDLSLGYLTGI